MLKDSDLVGCINETGIRFTEENLQQPNPAQVQQIFEWFAEQFLNATRETIHPAMCAAAEDVCGEFADVVPTDTRNLLGFFVSLRRLLAACGITDFTFNDLYKPTYKRLVKIFSYLVNLVRFRETQAADIIDQHYEKSASIRSRVEALYAEKQENDDRLGDMKRNCKAMEAQVREKMTRNEALKQRLKELKKNGKEELDRVAEAEQKKRELEGHLEKREKEKEVLEQESNKLRPYAQQSLPVLQDNLAQLHEILNRDQAHIDALDRRAPALQTSAKSFAAGSEAVASCIKIFEEIDDEIVKEEEAMASRARQREALDKRATNLKEIERDKTVSDRKLSKLAERTEKLREQNNAKAEEANDRKKQLRAEHSQLTKEQKEKGHEMEIRRVRIEQTERKVWHPLTLAHLRLARCLPVLTQEPDTRSHRKH